jgi:hypothetical protein
MKSKRYRTSLLFFHIGGEAAGAIDTAPDVFLLNMIATAAAFALAASASAESEHARVRPPSVGIFSYSLPGSP